MMSTKYFTAYMYINNDTCMEEIDIDNRTFA